jgi:hypothetical protein
MGGSASMVTILIVAIFLSGVTLGLVATVSVGSRREDRRFSLSGAAPGVVARGARRLVGLSGTGTHFQPRRRVR